MDKSWIDIRNRLDPTYIQGVEKFLEFAYDKKHPDSKIYCPCTKCMNLIFGTRSGVKEHLIVNGFNTKYTRWTIHGESLASCSRSESDANQSSYFQDDMIGMVHDAFGVLRQDGGIRDNEGLESMGLGPDKETKKFFKLLEDAQRELYPNCKTFTALSFTTHLLHIKVLGGWTDTSYDMLVELLRKAFPIRETLPKSFAEAKKFNEALGFSYEKIDACPKDCMLFWKDKKGLRNCEKCGTSRYKKSAIFLDDGTAKLTQIPAKQVRHFPLKLALQKLFMSEETSKHMRWHAEGRTNDGKWRHPADTPAWKIFDEKHPEFAKDIRNVRLGLAADGFNPFRTMSISHSTWPVVLMPYNLPPWLCMKQPFFILALLIDGPHGPGNDIDLYLQHLIEELKELWTEGVLTFDASTQQMFRMRATILMGTINDFPALAILSGWSTKGALACPSCNVETQSLWLKNFRKYCYMGHRRFLDQGHNFRKDAISFDGTIETRPRPLHLSGADIFKQVQFIQNNFGKGKEKGRTAPKKRRVHADEGISANIMVQGVEHNWKKRSTFFDLEYWPDILIRHNIDLMHTEKNVLENILGTLPNILGKTKDNLKARQDLKVMCIRPTLHPQQRPGGKVFLPPASFTMSKEQKYIFCKVLKNVKVPDGYSSNISRCVNLKDTTIAGLKSHDCHILMQQLLPLAVRRALPRHVCEALIELSTSFRRLCSKVMDPNDFEDLKKQIALTLCRLEKSWKWRWR
ncbi:hypothetical protein RHSIM_Rhsim09G0134500 [Rhododendron simsii]|uniref:Transposase-associated domain-containing protein n=1 Tax=Rhododendron simsii TaxID=118357 RepID=A0A834GGY4_RHOSS|nr:hypothetical protein RHSIM_Rhsim09G0134500 [Rhododendron simsii]